MGKVNYGVDLMEVEVPGLLTKMGWLPDVWGYFPMGMTYNSQLEQTLNKESMTQAF